MSEEMILRHCAPTLAGIKTGSLFRCAYTSPVQLREELRRLNRSLTGKGLRVMPLQMGERTALIYVYRPAQLRDDLACHDAATLLEQQGYRRDDPGRCVAQLMGRLRQTEGEFPHEIGLFLGYPPEDVRGFMEDSTACKHVGVWKVYGDEKAARRLFARYRRCTAAFLQRHSRGHSLERLAVAG